MFADGQDNVLICVAESVVRGQEGSDLIGVDLGSCGHKKALVVWGADATPAWLP